MTKRTLSEIIRGDYNNTFHRPDISERTDHREVLVVGGGRMFHSFQLAAAMRKWVQAPDKCVKVTNFDSGEKDGISFMDYSSSISDIIKFKKNDSQPNSEDVPFPQGCNPASVDGDDDGQILHSNMPKEYMVDDDLGMTPSLLSDDCLEIRDVVMRRCVIEEFVQGDWLCEDEGSDNLEPNAQDLMSKNVSTLRSLIDSIMGSGLCVHPPVFGSGTFPLEPFSSMMKELTEPPVLTYPPLLNYHLLDSEHSIEDQLPSLITIDTISSECDDGDREIPRFASEESLPNLLRPSQNKPIKNKSEAEWEEEIRRLTSDSSTGVGYRIPYSHKTRKKKRCVNRNPETLKKRKKNKLAKENRRKNRGK